MKGGLAEDGGRMEEESMGGCREDEGEGMEYRGE